MQHCSFLVYFHDNHVIAADRQGHEMAKLQAGQDDGAVVQTAIDACGRGGSVALSAGRFILRRSLTIHGRLLLRGEGRNTELVPPRGDYALRILYIDGGPHRSRDNFDRPPHITDPGWKADYDPRTYGIVLEKFCVRGERSGKGLSLSCMHEGRFRDLWFVGLYDGAAICCERGVMECDFESIHIENCGSAANSEAAIRLRSETGDSCNNLHFRNVHVILPQYVGIEIGDDTGPNHPRIVYFTNCFVHGWLPVEEPPPYDLVVVNHTDAVRGVFLHDSRFTNCGKEQAHIRIRDGQVRIAGCVIGGGNGRELVAVEDDARLNMVGNQLQDTISLEHYLFAEDAHVLFNENIITSENGRHADVRIVRGGPAIVCYNRFLTKTTAPAVVLETDDFGQHCIRDNVFAGKTAEQAVVWRKQEKGCRR